jgi:hypothetical protein
MVLEKKMSTAIVKSPRPANNHPSIHQSLIPELPFPQLLNSQRLFRKASRPPSKLLAFQLQVTQPQLQVFRLHKPSQQPKVLLSKLLKQTVNLVNMDDMDKALLATQRLCPRSHMTPSVNRFPQPRVPSKAIQTSNPNRNSRKHLRPANSLLTIPRSNNSNAMPITAITSNNMVNKAHKVNRMVPYHPNNDPIVDTMLPRRTLLPNFLSPQLSKLSLDMVLEKAKTVATILQTLRLSKPVKLLNLSQAILNSRKQPIIRMAIHTIRALIMLHI